MNIRKALATGLCLALLAGAASGCGGEEEYAEEPEVATETAAAASPGASDGPPPRSALTRKRRGVTTFQPDPKELGVAPTPPGASKKHPHLARNMKFDALRSQGITEVYDGKTKQALATFDASLKVRPDDTSVKLWVDAIRTAIKEHKQGAKEPAKNYEELLTLLRTRYAFPERKQAGASPSPGMGPAPAAGPSPAAGPQGGFGNAGGVAPDPKRVKPRPTPSIDVNVVF